MHSTCKPASWVGGEVLTPPGCPELHADSSAVVAAQINNRLNNTLISPIKGNVVIIKLKGVNFGICR